MRSRSQIREKGLAHEPFPGPMKGHSFQRSQDIKQSQHNKDPHNESEATTPSPKSQSGKGHQQKDLSRDDLLFLLSILEGELQARDEVITILKAEKVDLALLEAQYGFATPKKVLQALQRDAIQAKAAPWQEDIYERPMNEIVMTAKTFPHTKGQMKMAKMSRAARTLLHQEVAQLVLSLAAPFGILIFILLFSFETSMENFVIFSFLFKGSNSEHELSLERMKASFGRIFPT